MGASAKISDLCPVEEILTLRMDEFSQLQQAALAAWAEDSKPTVEVEPEKKESGKAQASS